MFTIKLVDGSSGKPAQGNRVSINFKGLFDGGFSEEQYTDKNGETHWEYDPAEGTVYVDRLDKFTGKLEGRVLIYL